MAKKVVILGGGVAGMSAAHELMERGFEVEVYEMRVVPGGKARSYSDERTAKGGKPGLPAEHGFRFFPRFYKHLPDTMKRIPYPGNANGVLGNLVDATRLEFCRFGQTPFVVSARFPITPADWKVVIAEIFHPVVQIKEDEKKFFAERVWQLLTSCQDRRVNEYERLDWWDYVDADAPGRSEAYREFFALGLTRSLVAANARKASTKTIGDIFLQLFFDMIYPGVSSDRLLNGPTNDVWIDPWLKYLQSPPAPLIPVKYHFDAEVVSINCDKKQVVSATIRRLGIEHEVKGDYYLAAVPVEVMARLVSPEMLQIDQTLEDIVTLAKNVNSMVGIQFYLRRDVEVVRGHVAYVDSPWAVTSISQHQFWKNVDLSKYGNGEVRGIISADISEWDQAGILYNKTADQCTPEEIKNEVWEQMKRSLNVDGQTVLTDDNLVDWNLEMDVVPDPHKPGRMMNLEPLLVNYVSTWGQRPNAFTAVPNLFLASDYVKTNTDIACMEAANEAARRAVNRILTTSGVRAPFCRIWGLREPFFFFPWRCADQRRYNRGLPWNGKLFG
ncbi:MAG: FAD-dependent oxidoreductase [Blastocatellia bacterium]|nr:FAD-dependent oxidoreductase [Blastocatellia bacterium]